MVWVSGRHSDPGHCTIMTKRTLLRLCSGTLHSLSRPPPNDPQFPDHLVRPILMALSSTRHFCISCCLFGRVSLANGAQAGAGTFTFPKVRKWALREASAWSFQTTCELDLEEAPERLLCG